MIGPGIFQQLTGDAAVAAIIGQRVFSSVGVPDLSQLPCLVVSTVGGSVDYTLSTSGVLRQRVQIDALSMDSEQCGALRDAAMLALSGWHGPQTSGANVLDTLLLNPGTEFVDEERVFRQMLEFYVFYTLPTS